LAIVGGVNRAGEERNAEKAEVKFSMGERLHGKRTHKEKKGN